MKRYTITMIVMVAVLFTAAYASAFRGRCTAMGNGPGFCGAALSIPDLTDTQRATITGLKADFYNDQQALRTDMMARHAELRTLMNSETLDKDAIAATQEAISELSQKMQKQAMDFQVSVAEVLTPEQRTAISNNTCPRGYNDGPGQRCGKGFHGGCCEKGQGRGMAPNCPRL